MRIEKEMISAFATMMKALSNETRLSILYKLFERPRTWTELIFELKINPKSLRDHLRFLKKSGLVKKKETGGFELTDAGKAFFELSLEDLISTAEYAARTSGK